MDELELRPVSGLSAGAPVYDRDGYRVGIVDGLDLASGAVIVVRAGLGLGTVSRELELPLWSILEAQLDRVTLSLRDAELVEFVVSRAAARELARVR